MKLTQHSLSGPQKTDSGTALSPKVSMMTCHLKSDTVK